MLVDPIVEASSKHQFAETDFSQTGIVDAVKIPGPAQSSVELTV